MNMKGVTASNPPGLVDKNAILAGNDLLELAEDVSRAIAEVKKALKEGKINQRDIDDRCRKILAVKYWLGLHHTKNVDVSNIINDLNPSSAKLLNRDLIQAAITVLKNDNGVLPIRDLDKIRVASVSVGRDHVTTFQRTLSLYTRVDHFVIPGDTTQSYLDSIAKLLKNYNQVIAGIHDDPGRPHNRISFSESVQHFISSLATQPNVIIAVFKNPYVLNKLDSIEEADGLIITYQDNADIEDLAAQLVFGGIGASGRMPVTVGDKFSSGDGIDVTGGIRRLTCQPGNDCESNSRLPGICGKEQKGCYVQSIRLSGLY